MNIVKTLNTGVIIFALLIISLSQAQVNIRPLTEAEYADHVRQLQLQQSLQQQQVERQNILHSQNQLEQLTQPNETIEEEVVSVATQESSKAAQIATIKTLKNTLSSSAWPPNLNSTWQVQLLLDDYNPIDTSIAADIYDIEIDTPQAVIDELKRKGHKVICYLNAGTAESFRPAVQTVFGGDLASDSALLEQWRSRGILGNVYGERFGNEFWMNPKERFTRNYVLASLNKCKHKGFDGVSFDNLDGYSFDKWNPEPEQTGFKLTEADQLEYNLWLIQEAHNRGLYAGLKNTPEIAEQLSQAYDWIFVESCYSEKVRGWQPACDNYARYFATKGKAIYLNEYDWNMQDVADETGTTLQALRKQYCSWAEEDGIYLMFRVDDTKSARLLCKDIL